MAVPQDNLCATISGRRCGARPIAPQGQCQPVGVFILSGFSFPILIGRKRLSLRERVKERDMTMTCLSAVTAGGRCCDSRKEKPPGEREAGHRNPRRRGCENSNEECPVLGQEAYAIRL